MKTVQFQAISEMIVNPKQSTTFVADFSFQCMDTFEQDSTPSIQIKIVQKDHFDRRTVLSETMMEIIVRHPPTSIIFDLILNVHFFSTVMFIEKIGVFG